jgi:hypothetical protein
VWLLLLLLLSLLLSLLSGLLLLLLLLPLNPLQAQAAVSNTQLALPLSAAGLLCSFQLCCYAMMSCILSCLLPSAMWHACKLLMPTSRMACTMLSV